MQLATLQRVALEAAYNAELEPVLRAIVQGLASDPGVALARLWLIGPGDLCQGCFLRAECPDQTRCLHLAASDGASTAELGERWRRTDGAFRRFPIGVRKVGRIAGTGRPEYLTCSGSDRSWIARPEWAEAEGITSFAGEPLVFRGEVLGVLALFCRGELDSEHLAWLRMFADQAAVAIANARAFEEIEGLRARLELERDYLRTEIRDLRQPSGIVGESSALRSSLRVVSQVAASDASVLVLGETGTGKELVACALHEQSHRAAAPLVKVNCAATPAALFESEFFGHAKGAFTGATHDRPGRFEIADGGTIFLDEVGEIPLELQGKLLRVLQEGQFSRVGEELERTVDIRVVAATNRDLAEEARLGRFREDLYYRLAVVTVELPPLRERGGDVALLANHFLRDLAARRNAPVPALRPEDLEALEAYDWPGNVRELHSVIERAVLLSSEGRLHLDLGPSSRSRRALADDGPGRDCDGGFDTEPERLARMKRDVLSALEVSGGRVSGSGGAATLLGVKATTLASRIKSLGIERGFR